MAGPHVAVVDGGVGLRPPARLLPVRVGSDLLQQLQPQRAALVVPPEDSTASARVSQGSKVSAPYLMKGLRRRDVYGLLMLGSRLPSAPIRRCQKVTDRC